MNAKYSVLVLVIVLTISFVVSKTIEVSPQEVITKNKSVIQNDVSDFNISVEKEGWERRLSKEDIKKVYDDFKQFYNDATPDSQHFLAHTFGEMLFKIEGISGLPFCDYTFGGGGCFHELVSISIHENGFANISDLAQQCVELDSKRGILECKHGIGHGLLFYLGYTYTDVLESLHQCVNMSNIPKMSQDNFVRGCVGGVFMEYNANFSFDENGAQRVFDASRPYNFCDSLESSLGPACYFWMAQWWNISLFEFKDKYETISDLCSGVEDQENRKWCFYGMGHTVVPDSGWDKHVMTTICNTADSIEGRVYCQAYAAYVFAGELSGGYREAEGLCDMLQESSDTCIEQVNALRY